MEPIFFLLFFFLGIIFGIIFILLILILFSIIITYFLTKKKKEFEIFTFQKNVDFSANWINLIIHRFFDCCLRSNSIHQVALYFSDKIQTDSSSTKFSLINLHMEESPLYINKFRINSSENGDYIQIELTFIPNLNLNAFISHQFLSITNPLKLDCTVLLKSITGTINLMIPYQFGLTYLCFTSNTLIDFDFSIKFGSYLINTIKLGMISETIKTLLHNKIYSSKIIFSKTNKKKNSSNLKLINFNLKLIKNL